MKKSGFWKADWFLGVVVTLLVLATVSSDLVQSLERKAYDLGVKAASRTPSDKIAVIAIDKQSIDNIGRWPWPREVHARMTDILSAARAKVISNNAFFFEPQIDPGLTYINKLLVRYYDRAFPSLPVMVAARSLNLQLSDIKLGDEALQVGRLRIRTDDSLRMNTFFYSGKDGVPAFPVDSFFDVLVGKIPASKYQDKIVLTRTTWCIATSSPPTSCMILNPTA